MSKKGGGQVKETSQERALAEVGKAQMDDFKARWQPVQQKFAAGIVKAGGPDSFERGRATTMAGVDNAVRFGAAGETLDARAAATGGFGASGHKLAITGMAEDRATSTGLGAVAADQAVSDQYVTGLGSVMALGRGEKAGAVSGMSQNARMAAATASSEADRSLQEQAGQYQLAGTAAGIGVGLWSGGAPQRDVAAANMTDDPIAEMNRRRGWTS